jgi:hypothetical protein
METTSIKLNKQLVEEATAYARRKGQSLSSMLEDYLSRITRKKEIDVPDIVLSLLGAGESIEDDDINGRKAYYKYLNEKYQ